MYGPSEVIVARTRGNSIQALRPALLGKRAPNVNRPRSFLADAVEMLCAANKKLAGGNGY